MRMTAARGDVLILLRNENAKSGAVGDGAKCSQKVLSDFSAAGLMWEK